MIGAADPVQDMIDGFGDVIARAGEAGAQPVDVITTLARILGTSIATAAPSPAAASGILSGCFAVMLDVVSKQHAGVPVGSTLQ